MKTIKDLSWGAMFAEKSKPNFIYRWGGYDRNGNIIGIPDCDLQAAIYNPNLLNSVWVNKSFPSDIPIPDINDYRGVYLAG